MSIIEPEQFRLEKLEELRRCGVNPYGRRFPETTPISELREAHEPDTEQRARAAGRITNLRSMGRASFMDIKDRSGSIQAFFKLDKLGEERFHIHSQLEPGDIIGVCGTLTTTRTGELTIFVEDFAVLSKALLSPPEKWHGLRDQEKRYRQRSVDLFTNDEVMNSFLKRSQAIRAIRGYLEEEGFVEVETPMMQTVAGGATARPFLTHHQALGLDLYLRIAPELYLKRLLVGGVERVFEINRNFRNEGISAQHNPEFTMLELYQAYADFTDMMELTEKLLSKLAEQVCGSLHLTYDGEDLDFSPPWPKERFWDLLERHTDAKRDDESSIRETARAVEIDGASEDHPDVLAVRMFEKIMKGELTGPIFVTHYPKSVCPLAKASSSEPDLAERFELYLGGMECANSYTELNDPLEQEQRFMEQVGEQEERERTDREFLRALAYGMPPAGGLGIGIDSLMMALTDSANIREVILFPLLRPQQ